MPRKISHAHVGIGCGVSARLGSKSTSIEMTAISVDMKVAIEQLREQVQNVE